MSELATLRRWLEDLRAAVVRKTADQVLKEYARHLGHLDLLREAIDGRTGE